MSASRHLHGRTLIRTDYTEITEDNIREVLEKALTVHNRNRADIQYLYDYYRGKQPVLERVKEVRPEINNKIVENRANEIVAFKSGYLMGEPLQYVSRGYTAEIGKAVNRLNAFTLGEEKSTKDKEVADWFHICGTAFRMILPDARDVFEDDDAPFEIYTLDPRNTFVVYNNGLGEKPVLGVRYVKDEENFTHYSCYTDTEYFEIVDRAGLIIEKHDTHIMGDVPIIEYPLNDARLGAFEIVLPLLDAINSTDSNRMDGVEQFVQALMLFHNVDISDDDFTALREQGAIKFKDIDQSMRAEINYLVSNLSQGETQTLQNHYYNAVLTICGMPNRNGSSSTSDTGSAVMMRDGWSAAEARAKDAELMFKKSERKLLKIMLRICETLRDLNLKVSDIEIRFTRRNYENIYQKAQVLDLLLRNGQINPKLAFAACGLFIDSELAYTESMEYVKEQLKSIEPGDNGDEYSKNYSGNGLEDGRNSETREASGVAD